MDISRRVGNLKRRWGTADPFKICSFLKIQVNYSDLGDIKGFYKNILGKKFIVINSTLNTFDRKIVRTLFAALQQRDKIFIGT